MSTPHGKPYAVKNQKGNFLSTPYFDKVIDAYLKDKAFVEVDDVRIDIKGPNNSDENIDRIVIDVFIHGLE